MIYFFSVRNLFYRRYYRFFGVCLLIISIQLIFNIRGHAFSKSDSVTQIPKGTIFTFKSEFEVPANTKFVLTGKNEVEDFFSKMGQTLNQNAGRYYSDRYTYQDYFNYLTENTFKTYRKCRERHRVYVTPDNINSSNQNIQQGNNNTNIIINNNNSPPGTIPQTQTYIGSNPCMKPEFTYSALVIHSDYTDKGGIFRKGYKFKVKKVTSRRNRKYFETMIYFDHKVARGLVIISSANPSTIWIMHLEDSGKRDEGFWGTIAGGLSDMTNICENNFTITLPEKEYFD